MKGMEKAAQIQNVIFFGKCQNKVVQSLGPKLSQTFQMQNCWVKNPKVKKESYELLKLSV